ncbi:MAG: glycosyltransferase [Cryomorphaceae bacterium]|nr:glycosyltransferase [Cryomorphaceae bacterium]
MSKKILFCVLNWGLGHATRSIPIIERLLDEGHQLHIASDGQALDILRHAFPQLIFHKLPAYNIKYAKHSVFWWALLLQIPKMIQVVFREKKAVKQLYQKNVFDWIISDNRLGCRHPNAHNIFISHQLTIKGGVVGMAATRIHRHIIKKHQALWIPDDKYLKLSGELSTWKNNPLPTKWLGRLSRVPGPVPGLYKKYDAMILLSGPEPQRSILEKWLLDELCKKQQSILCIRGTNTTPIETSDQVEVIPFAQPGEISRFLSQSKRLYCRSGYSTIMDIQPYDIDVTLIPTPGQSEQEYLAEYHKEKSGYSIMRQP